MLWQAMAEVAKQRGEHLAVVSDEASLSHAELSSKVSALAGRLGALGVGPGQVVLAHLDNVPAFLVLLLATAELGATFAPLDVGLTDAEAASIVELVGADLVVCGVASVERCQRFSRNVLVVDAVGTLLATHSAGLTAGRLDSTIGCIQFSSGTTGKAKGILLSHEALLHRARDVQRALGLGAEDRTLCALPLSHPHGAECLALPTLLGGGTLFLKSPRFAFPLYILEELARLRISFFSSIPSFYDFAVKLSAAQVPDLSALRLPFCGSAALSTKTAEAFFARYGVHIHQGYGLAELAVICVNFHDRGPRAYDSVGTPLAGIDWKLTGGGSEGELCVRSKGLFSGYLHDEAATREKLCDGFLHTGDIVSVDEHGLFRIVGRKDDFVKVNGLKVFAAELEVAIVGLPWVGECAVLTEKDAHGSESLVAHVVPRDAALAHEVVQQTLLSELRGVVSDYKLPRRSVVWRELPKNALGKVLKARLREKETTMQTLTPSGKGLRITDRPVTDFSVSEIRALLDRYHFLAFTGNPISSEEATRFLGQFGPLTHNDRRQGAVLKIDGSKKSEGEVLLGDGFLPLHRDGALMGTNVVIVGIHCELYRDVSEGGRTFITDVESASKVVPQEIMDLLRERGIEGRPVDRYYLKPSDQWHAIKGFLEVEGESYLNVGFPYRAGEQASWLVRIPGVDDASCTDLFDKLSGIMMSDTYCYYHEWQEGDLLLFDNRKTLHGREAFRGQRALANIQVLGS